jgi:hypothetical protein
VIAPRAITWNGNSGMPPPPPPVVELEELWALEVDEELFELLEDEMLLVDEALEVLVELVEEVVEVVVTTRAQW